MASQVTTSVVVLILALETCVCGASLKLRVRHGRGDLAGSDGRVTSCGWEGKPSPPMTTSAMIAARPPEVMKHMERVCDTLKKRGREKTCEMFEKAYPNTVDTTAEVLPLVDADGTVSHNLTYVSTGDIPDMWLRDSSAQVNHYIKLLGQSGGSRAFKKLLEGLFHRQMRLYMSNPYANSFRKDSSVAEEKYEIDSVCYVMNLGYRIWKQTGDDSIFNKDYLKFLGAVLNQWTTEQFHDDKSHYDGDKNRPLPGDRESRRVKSGVGLIWQGYRPSDDACEYHYNIPSNMMAVVQLQHAEEVLKTMFKEETALVARAESVRQQIDHGIHEFGRGEHPRHGEVYAYEVNGFGRQVFMDDANVPSLLSIPYLGYSSPHHHTAEVYNRTRSFVLSTDNPYYFEGAKAKGVGSAHTTAGCIWPLGIIMEALTTRDRADKLRLLEAIERTTAGTGRMHESFSADDDAVFTRGWFGWAASLFSELVEEIAL